MLTIQKTSVYQDCTVVVKNLIQFFGKNPHDPVNSQLLKEAVKIPVNFSKALNELDIKENYDKHIKNTIENVLVTISLVDLASKTQNIGLNQLQSHIADLSRIKKSIASFADNRKKILILSSTMGQGHMSASKAVKQGLEELYGYSYRVEIVDFWDTMNAFVNKVTQKTYEGSTKFAPKIYKLIFAGTDTKWQMKLINQINYPFVLSKIKAFFEEKNPDLVISTYPIWNYLIAEIWKKVKPSAKFISIVTDSISIHNAWAIANTDCHIVANEDTALSLRKLGVKQDNIKILGFPVRLDFINTYNRDQVLSQMGLNPKKFTILFLPAAQTMKLNLSIMNDLVEGQKDCNLIVITGRDQKIKPKLEKISAANGVKFFAWTDMMPAILKTTDLVITKAGGATVMECIASEKPMIITSVIPGQEEGNAELIKKYHLGIIPAEGNMTLKESINHIRQNYKQFQKSLAKQSNPRSALKIAEFLNSLL